MAMMSDARGSQHNGGLTAVIGSVLLVVPRLLLAAPFCVQTQAIPPQCIYADAAACDTRARQMGGTCSANPSEVHVYGGLGHFCLLTSGKTSSCVYPDRSDCDREAQHQRGVCIQAPDRPESPGPDPYRYVRPLMVGG
jgi:hypothetical protein